MKYLIFIFLSYSALASSPIAPIDVAILKKISQTKESQTFISVYHSSEESKQSLIERFNRLCFMNSLECSVEEKKIDSKLFELSLKVKDQVSMSQSIEDLLKSL